MRSLGLKSVLIVCVFACLGLLCSCSADKVRNSVGRYETEEFYTCGGFQDYTDYAKYTYSEMDLDGNRYFSPVTDTAMEQITAYLDNFDDAVHAHDSENEIVVHYDFDRTIIDDKDAYCIVDRADEADALYQPLESYDVYIVDAQTNTLYYFHNNI